MTAVCTRASHSTNLLILQWLLMLESVDHKVDADASTRWMVRLRRPAESRPTFVFFPHAGGSPLSAGRLVNALPSTVWIMVANLPRGGDIDDACPPHRVAAATKGLTDGFLPLGRSEERRVGKGCVRTFRFWWSRIH